MRAGSNAEARATYEAALAERPGDPLILTSYGLFLETQGEHRAAVDVLERIAPPRSPEAAAALAKSRRRLDLGTR